MDPDRLKVSVVTVVYNGVAFVAETIESVLAQQGVACEYWVIDGGSTDGTIDIIKRYAPRLAGWISEADAGIADAFNKGLDRARGQYVMFLNADDYLAYPRALADLVEYAHSNGLPDVVYGDTDLLDPATDEVMYRSAIPYVRERFVAAGTLPHAGALTHRRYFDLHGRFDTSYRVAMDYEFFLRGVPKCGALRAPFRVSCVRLGGVSARNRRWVIDETVRALRTHGYLSWLGEMRLRAGYMLRFGARQLLARVGLYGAFNAWRRSRVARVTAHGSVR